MQIIGKTLGQYRIIEELGHGGMATIYKAYQPTLDRFVAIKVLSPKHAEAPGFKERFFLEARAVAKLSHPNILPVHDLGIEEGWSYIVMKLVSGSTMRKILGEPMPFGRVSNFIDQIARGLDHAHAQGVIHRDIKPSNLLLQDEWVLIADFGLAKIVEASVALTATGELMGTPAYMSPEQGSGRPVDCRTDIYSLGIVLYEMITGKVPFTGETPYGIIFKHVNEPLPLPRSYVSDLSEDVERVILKALAKEPEHRFESAGKMAGALREALTDTLKDDAWEPPHITRPLEVQDAPPEEPRQDAAQPQGATQVLPSQQASEPHSKRKPSSSIQRVALMLAGVALITCGIVLAFIYFTGKETKQESLVATGHTRGEAWREPLKGEDFAPKPKTPRASLSEPLSQLQVKILEPPDFKQTALPKITQPADLKLQIVSEKRNEITDEEAWFTSHGLTLPILQHKDIEEFAPKEFQGRRLYRAIRNDDRLLLIYGGGLLLVQRVDNKVFEYALDFSNYLFAPKTVESDRAFLKLELVWARQIGNILYVSYGHHTYARSSFGMNAYVSAIDLNSMKALWHSAPLVSNAQNFEALDSYLITGYGFTAEPDFLFLLRRDTGDAIAKIPVKSSPDYILLKDNRLYVRTYDTDYVFQILGRRGSSYESK